LHESLAEALADRYRIERELGAGGMATVYLAEDLKHDRRVALKVLKPELAAVLGAERFVAEIKTTASLQHPNILPLFDSGTAGGFLYYVMPYIDGETLRQRLDRETQLGVEEAVRIASDIADALDHAHAQDVIHRDIKPENILLANGRPMVADFGIALAVSAAAGGRMTETGLSLGTPHYMSPEQATADKDLTRRSDVYSLASVLYEMLTGDPPHTGSSAQAVIMKIVTDVPRPVGELRRTVPPNVAAAVAKALEKLPADRFESARDFAAAVADPHYGEPGAAGSAAGGLPLTWRGWLRDPRSWVALCVAAFGVGAALFSSSGATVDRGQAEALRFTILGPLDSTFVSIHPSDWYRPLHSPTVAPDGRHVAISVMKSAGPTLYLRDLGSFDVAEIEGERGFFSPDGQDLGFFRVSDLWKISVEEGIPSHVASIPESHWDIYAAAWHPDGRILVAASRGLWALPDRGGDPALLLAADASADERFGDVGLLPDGRIVLNVDSPAGHRIEVLSSDAVERERIDLASDGGTFVGDILVYTQSGYPRATRFDLRRLEPVGEPIALTALATQRIGRSLAWVGPDEYASLEPVWVSSAGVVTPVGLPAASYRWPRISPGGDRMVAGVDRLGAIVVMDITGGASIPLAGNSEPVWSPDGTRVFMSRENRPLGGLLVQAADGGRAPDTLLALGNADSWPTSVSPDGTWLAYYGATLGSGADGDASDLNDIFFLDLRSLESRRFRLPGIQRATRFSPDGRWVAYQSSETGRAEVYVRPWPAMDASFLVSSDGGTEPIWSSDGRQIYYRNRDRVMAVEVSAREGTLDRSSPHILFSGPFALDVYGDQSYDLAPDGRFLMLRPTHGAQARVQVELNWIDEVRGRLDRAR
jgi:tRNA A-37 threonylcarbamoyl transferase component Bud32